MKNFYSAVQLRIDRSEKKISFDLSTIIDDSREMTKLLQYELAELKKSGLKRFQR